MEEFTIDYSKKNIPIAGKDDYKIQLISKVEHFIKRMRWKAMEALGSLKSDEKETFGFRSRKCPPTVDLLTDFENDLQMMVKNVEFRNINNPFQTKMSNDIKEIRSSQKVFVPADKSRNVYKLEPENYMKLLKENVTKDYKKSDKEKVININNNIQRIAKSLSLEKRIECLQEKEAYITIKDHKENFPNKISCRLINPTKSDIGKLSKQILDRINKEIVKIKKINQWKNTNSVISWFNNIKEKQNTAFIAFDIEAFYPSITAELFDKAIQFAKNITTINDEELEIISQARRTLLFHLDNAWVKKKGDEDFDVPMGCYDGAEICELVGTYIITKLNAVIDKEDIGLYRDDGLAIIRNLSGPEVDRKRKGNNSNIQRMWVIYHDTNESESCKFPRHSIESE